MKTAAISKRVLMSDSVLLFYLAAEQNQEEGGSTGNHVNGEGGKLFEDP